MILLLFNAGPLDVSWAHNSTGVAAIVECFFPAQAAGTATFVLRSEKFVVIYRKRRLNLVAQ